MENKLTYELVKELRDAGFILITNRKVYGVQPESDTNTGEMTAIETSETSIDGIPDSFLTPTLRELIDACGGVKYTIEMKHYYFRLMGTDENWVAMYEGIDDFDELEAHGIGSTPEEAVARLYLALNKKNNGTSNYGNNT